MGNCSCSNNNPETYTERIQAISNMLEDEDLNFVQQETLTFSDLTNSAITIQNAFRSLVARKKFRKYFYEKLKKKKELIFAVSDLSTNDIFFNQFQEYEFSIKGLSSLQAQIENFYYSFFDIDFLRSAENIVKINTIKNLNYGDILSQSMRKFIIYQMREEFYLGADIEGIFSTTTVNNEIKISDFDPMEDLFDEIDYENIPQLSIRLDKDFLFNNTNDKLKGFEGLGDENADSNTMKDTDDFAKLIIRQSKGRMTSKAKYNKSTFMELLLSKRKESDSNKLSSEFLHHYSIGAKEKYNHDYRNWKTGSGQEMQRCKLFASPSDEIIHTQTSSHTNSNTNTNIHSTSDIYFRRFIDDCEIRKNKKYINKSFQDPLSKIIYSGSFNESSQTKEGLGIEYFTDPSLSRDCYYRYCGYFYKNKYHGIGMLIKANEAYYGEFRNGKENGYGFYYSKEVSYSGFFIDGKYHGYGEIQIKNKYLYEGLWREGLKEIFGYFKSNDGNEFSGEFQENHIEGVGRFKWRTGQSYLGQWKNDMMNGIGEYTYKNNDKFVGYYKNDLKNGKGIYFFDNGIRIKGWWEKGKKEGCFMYYPSNSTKGVQIMYENDAQLKI